MISVKDTGIGLKPEEIEPIFDPFEQAKNHATRNVQGTGLGLSLTKKLVELHGGRIWAESNGEGQGATFSLVIPLISPKAKPGPIEFNISPDTKTDSAADITSKN